MKKLLIAISLGLISSTLHAACVGPYCYDETGASITGQLSIAGTITNASPLGLPSKTLAQMNALAPTAAGQLIYVSDATRSKICVSSGTAAGAWIIAVSTGVFAAGSLEHCL